MQNVLFILTKCHFQNIAPDARQVPARRPPGASQTQLLKSGVRETPARRKPDAMFWNQASGARFKTLRLMPARREPDAMFQNQASDATFQNLPPDAQTCSKSPAMYLWKLSVRMQSGRPTYLRIWVYMNNVLEVNSSHLFDKNGHIESTAGWARSHICLPTQIIIHLGRDDAALLTGLYFQKAHTHTGMRIPNLLMGTYILLKPFVVCSCMYASLLQFDLYAYLV